MNRARQSIAILQYNLNKNRETTHSVLNDPTSSKYAVIMLQEQYFSKHTNSSLTHQAWTLIQSSSPTENTQPRAVAYINNTILPPSTYETIHLDIADTVALAIRMEQSNNPTLIINIYNTKGSTQINKLKRELRNHLQTKIYDGILIVGDFNLHHPLWNPTTYHVHDGELANDLIDTMAQLRLKPLLPAGTITFPRAKTAIDLVWGNAYIEQRIIKCKIAKNDHGSDHLPIETIINLKPKPETQTQQPLNYEKTDWKAMELKLEQYLSNVTYNSPIDTPHKVDQLANQLCEAITKAITESTPRKRTCHRSKRWWNSNLTTLHDVTSRLRNPQARTNNEEDHAEWKTKKREFRKEIRHAKREKWREFVSEADEQTIWQVLNYVETAPTTTYIPTLEGHAITNAQKADTLQKAFFPLPPPADLSDIATHQQYPPEITTNLDIQMPQIERAIEKLAPNKAPGPDEIPNHVLKRYCNTIKNHLLALAKGSLDTGHFPTRFKATTTLVLRKPNKPDYTKPKAYRPIALECTIGKVLESIIAEHISYLCETYNLLPNNHFGGRPGRTTEDAMLLLVENIHKAWKEGKIYSAVFMDVAGAFNNVHHERLIHNMRVRRIPLKIARWVQSFLSNRTTSMKYNGITTDSFSTPAGVPQGSPLSPILFILYNSELLDIPQRDELGLGFIDDIAYGVKSPTAAQNTARLEQLLKKAEKWRSKHGAQFEKSKYMLVHFTRGKKSPTDAPLIVEGTTIQPTKEARYLGVTFDQELKYRSHLDQAVNKGTKFTMAISGIARNSWGPKFVHLQRLFNAVAAPRMDYGAIIWHKPNDNIRSPTTVQLRKLATVQRQAMKTILGCFRTTSTSALEIETDMPPPQWRLTQKILQSVTRLKTTPRTHPIQSWITAACMSRQDAPHRSNLENLAHQYPEYMHANLETIIAYTHPPWWSPPINIHIEQCSKEEAKDRHLERLSQITTENTTIIYTDGSGINGNIGAAAYILNTNESRGKYIGTEKTHMVNGAELEAILTAVHIIH